MATILIKRSAVSASVPTPGNLSDGELAVNTTDGGLYYLNAADGTVKLLRASSSISSSYAITASYAANAGGAPSVSASYATTSSYALSASWAPGSGTSTSASYATTSSYAVTASYVSGSSGTSVSASYALSASWAPDVEPVTSSYATTASYAVRALSASYAPGSPTLSSSYADFALSASYAPGSPSLSSSYSDFALSSSYSLTASYAANAGGAPSVSASYALTASYAVNGGSGPGGTTITTYYLGSPGRTVSTLMIPSLGASASANYENSGSIRFGSSFYLFNVSSSLVSRVRLYSSESYLNADKTRAIGVDPTGEHGVMLDLVMSGSASYQVFNLAPPVVGFDASPSQTGSVTYLISNLTTGTSDITMSFTHVSIEGSVTSSGVVYIPAIDAPPVFFPTIYQGVVGMVYDVTGKTLYIHNSSSGVWNSASFG